MGGPRLTREGARGDFTRREHDLADRERISAVLPARARVFQDVPPEEEFAHYGAFGRVIQG